MGQVLRSWRRCRDQEKVSSDLSDGGGCVETFQTRVEMAGASR